MQAWFWFSHIKGTSSFRSSRSTDDFSERVGMKGAKIFYGLTCWSKRINIHQLESSCGIPLELDTVTQHSSVRAMLTVRWLGTNWREWSRVSQVHSQSGGIQEMSKNYTFVFVFFSAETFLVFPSLRFSSTCIWFDLILGIRTRRIPKWTRHLENENTNKTTTKSIILGPSRGYIVHLYTKDIGQSHLYASLWTLCDIDSVYPH